MTPVSPDLMYRLLIQSVADYAIYLLTPDGRVANWNPGAQRAKGYASEEIVGKHYSLFYHEDERAAGLPQQNLDQARRTGRFEGSGLRLRKDGSAFHAHVVIEAVRDEQGQLVGFAKTTRDISEHRRQEAELRQALITIRTAIDAYKQASDDGRVEKSVDASGYPPDLAALVDGVVDRKNPNGDRIYFLRRLPADPLCGCPGTSAADTWETRSYTSSSDAFASGKDVFDIRSKSGRKGINGIPYSQW